MKKVFILIIFLVFFLIACEKDVVKPAENKGSDVYATFEVGPNFTNHIWAIASEKDVYDLKLKKKLKGRTYDALAMWYEFAFTHEVDYLWPNIFYYIPLGEDFNTEDAWARYFKQWEKAIDDKDYDAIASYVEGSHVERYVKGVFENTSDDMWLLLYKNQIDVLSEISALYLKAFKDYEKDIWPELSLKLNEKTININENNELKNLIDKWSEVTLMPSHVSEYKFSLTYIQHDTFEYVQMRPNIFVCPADLYEDKEDYFEFISQRIGYHRLTQNQNELLKEIYQTYNPQSAAYNIFEEVYDVIDFTASQYNNLILDYDTKIYKDYLKNTLYNELMWKEKPVMAADLLLREQIIDYLESLMN